jgi:radical SAM protein with 4Fe4S-binding SPASM domain
MSKTFSTTKKSGDTAYHTNRLHFSDLLYKDDEMLPFRYVFVLTNRCNLRCSFCFQEKGVLPGSMTTPEWLNVVNQIPDYGHVTLTGGEPLVFKGFKDVFLAVTERLTCNLITNGILLDEEVIELLLSRPNLKVLSISVDNVGNSIRGVAPDKWKRTEAMLRHFQKRRDELKSAVVLDTKTVILDDNCQDLEAIHRYCMEELGADTHSFMFLKGAPIQHADNMYEANAVDIAYTAHQYKNFPLVLSQLEAVRKYNQASGKTCFTHPKAMDLNAPVAFDPGEFQYLNSPDHHKELFDPCRSPWESVHINVDGNMFPCMAVSMGNVKTTSLLEIVHGPDFRSFKKKIRAEGTVGGCNRCGYLRKCKKANAA